MKFAHHIRFLAMPVLAVSCCFLINGEVWAAKKKRKKKAEKAKIEEVSDEAVQASGMTNRRLLIFSASAPKERPKLIVYEKIPKPESISKAPILFVEFEKEAKSETSKKKVAPESVLLNKEVEGAQEPETEEAPSSGENEEALTEEKNSQTQAGEAEETEDELEPEETPANNNPAESEENSANNENEPKPSDSLE